jgi:hypothetical protein
MVISGFFGKFDAHDFRADRKLRVSLGSQNCNIKRNRPQGEHPDFKHPRPNSPPEHATVRAASGRREFSRAIPADLNQTAIRSPWAPMGSRAAVGLRSAISLR